MNMFDQLVQTVVDGGHGVRAYDACARAARARIASEPDNAAALTLILFAAQGVVEAYDDQPLPVDESEALLEKFRDMVATLDKAYADGAAEAKLAALNAVAAKLADVARI
jgi:hypothetical protein